jgi:hypothetical protein
VLIVGKSPDDDETAIIHDKTNLAEKKSSVGFELIGTMEGVARVKWTGLSKLDTYDLTVEIERKTVQRSGTKQAAIEFLREQLAGGTEKTRDHLENAAMLRDVTFCWKTLERALKELGAVNRKGRKEEGGKSFWRLPMESDDELASLNGHVTIM